MRRKNVLLTSIAIGGAGVLALSALAAVFAQSGGGYELTGRMVDSDSESLSGGGYELSGTGIRPRAVTGGEFSLTGEFSASAETPLSVPCSADLLEPPGVGVEDLLELLDSWGETDSPGDLDGDGTIGPGDLAIILGHWGPCR